MPRAMSTSIVTIRSFGTWVVFRSRIFIVITRKGDRWGRELPLLQFLTFSARRCFPCFISLRQRELLRAVDLSSNSFDYDSVFDGSGPMTLSSFFFTSSSIFLSALQSTGLEESCASVRFLCTISSSVFMDASEWDRRSKLFINMGSGAFRWIISNKVIWKKRKKALNMSLVPAWKPSFTHFQEFLPFTAWVGSLIGVTVMWFNNS